MYHPPSSYIPFFVFLATVVVITVIIVLLVGRLLGMVEGQGSPAATATSPPAITATATHVAHAGAAPGPAQGKGTPPPARATAGPTPPPPVVFALRRDAAGAPMRPAITFSAAAPRVYGFATLRDVPAGAAVHFVWSRGGQAAPLFEVSEHSRGPALAQHTFLSYLTPDQNRFATGSYTVTVSLAGQVVARGSFTIHGP